MFYRSEVVHENLNPKWREWSLDLEEIGGLDSPFTIQVFDWDSDGGHGSIYIYVSDLDRFNWRGYYNCQVFLRFKCLFIKL